MYSSEDILEEGAKFYRNLYDCTNISSEEIDKYLDGISTNTKLTKVEALLCEGQITNEECEIVIKQMAKNKTPGYDAYHLNFTHISGRM